MPEGLAEEQLGAKRPEEDVDQRGARADLGVEQLDHARSFVRCDVSLLHTATAAT